MEYTKTIVIDDALFNFEVEMFQNSLFIFQRIECIFL
jgi:hypothetical protein